jgi:flagellar hook-associated protein 1 FlgK
MPGLFGLLEIGRRGLAAQSTAMNVTSHNIANANALGYTRQRVDFGATMPLRNAQGLLIGTGVSIDAIERLRDRFIDTQFRQANSSLGSASLRHNILSQIEAGLGEPSANGLQALLSGFFNSFQELASHPEESAPRQAVLQQATQLVSAFNRISSNFTTQRTALADEASNKVDRINELTRQIAELNRQIAIARSSGSNVPSDLMDRRDEALDQLSELTSITASLDSQGAMIVSIGGVMVAGNGTSVTLQGNVVNGVFKVTAPGGQDVPITGGELGSALELYNTTIPGYMTQLDDLANALIARVNAVHAAGYGLGNPPRTGINFFTGSGASGIAINSQISSDINNIAASSTGAPGDNRNALALFGISTEQIMGNNTLTLAQYYGNFVSNLGAAVSSAEGSGRGAELVLAQLTMQRESVSGVSLDEEMTNMIKFQRSFEAAARIVQTTDELIRTILNMV